LCVWREYQVVIIVRDEALAQQALTAGTLACPHAGCGGLVYRDGRARARRVRTRDGGERELRPQRVACRRCERVNVVLPAWCVPGRCDDAETIGVALLAAAQGAWAPADRRAAGPAGHDGAGLVAGGARSCRCAARACPSASGPVGARARVRAAAACWIAAG
jgi:hypothetical protein